VQREYGKIVASLTLTTAAFFGGGIILAMLYVGPQIQPEGRASPLFSGYSFLDVVGVGIVFGTFAAIVALILLVLVVRHDRLRCQQLSKKYDAPLGRVLFLTQSCVVRLGLENERPDVFNRALKAVKSLRVWLKVADRSLGCIEAYTKPFFASRITVKIDKRQDFWEIVAVSAPISGLLILDWGRNFEIVNQLGEKLRQAQAPRQKT